MVLLFFNFSIILHFFTIIPINIMKIAKIADLVFDTKYVMIDNAIPIALYVMIFFHDISLSYICKYIYSKNNKTTLSPNTFGW